MMPEPEFDFLILADRAEAINGKLYMMGGAWDAIGLRALGDVAAFTAAVGIVVPWHATNMEHHVTLRLEDADVKTLTSTCVGFATGRPATLPDGARQRVTFALPLNIVFPTPGTYVVVCTVGVQEKRVAFQVHIHPPAPAPR